jgi:hypothetical protein
VFSPNPATIAYHRKEREFLPNGLNPKIIQTVSKKSMIQSNAQKLARVPWSSKIDKKIQVRKHQPEMVLISAFFSGGCLCSAHLKLCYLERH